MEGLDAPGAGVYALVQTAIHDGISLAEAALRCQVTGRLRYQALIDERRLLAPLTHPEPSRMLVSGTGLTHLGSAASRDAMHSKLQADAQMTDSMKMFKAGLERGSPRPGEIGFQPEWFYKGDGSNVVAPEQPIPVPAFAQDAGDEPELVALYVIGFDGTPHRAGFAVGNEFSDHVTERFNYLWLAHSKLRSCSYGPELLVGDLPADLQGTSRSRWGHALGKALPDRRGQHVPHDREPRAPPFPPPLNSIRLVSCRVLRPPSTGSEIWDVAPMCPRAFVTSCVPLPPCQLRTRNAPCKSGAW